MKTEALQDYLTWGDAFVISAGRNPGNPDHAALTSEEVEAAHLELYAMLRRVLGPRVPILPTVGVWQGEEERGWLVCSPNNRAPIVCGMKFGQASVLMLTDGRGELAYLGKVGGQAGVVRVEPLGPVTWVSWPYPSGYTRVTCEDGDVLFAC